MTVRVIGSQKVCWSALSGPRSLELIILLSSVRLWDKRPQRHLGPPLSKYHRHYSVPLRRSAP